MQYYLSLFPSITPACLEAMSGKNSIQTTSTSHPITLSSKESEIYKIFEQSTTTMNDADRKAGWNNLLECMTQSNWHSVYAVSQSIGLGLAVANGLKAFNIIKHSNPIQNPFTRKELGRAVIYLTAGLALTYFGVTNLNANAHICCENKLDEMN